MKKPVLCILLLLLAANVWADRNKRALRLIEKEKFDKAYSLLTRSLEKDSINPGAHYAFSKLFIDSLYAGYSIDSSWRHINLAIRLYPEADDKTLQNLRKNDITDSTILFQKRRVDSAAFRVAVSLHTIPAYDYFIDVHADALQVPEAKERRNALAWEKASEEHTYMAYKYFVDTYPDAKQAQEASELYNVLIFDEKTKDKNLASFIAFLSENPETPYRSEAEKNIFILGAAENTPDGYLWFIQNYASSRYAVRAMNFLYHLYKEGDDPAGFYDEYTIARNDSLTEIISLDKKRLIPVYKNGLYGFMDLQWDTVFTSSFRFIADEYRCGNVAEDVLLAAREDSLTLMARNGATVFGQTFDDFADLGYGVLKIRKNGLCGVWHKSGWRIRDFEFDDASVINGQFIKAYKNEKYGLYSFTGVGLTPLDYDQIEFMDGFYIFQKGERFAPATSERILNTLKGEEWNPDFRFEEVEPLEERYLLCYQGGKETLLDKDLQIVIPLADHKIYRVNQGWLVRSGEGYQALDQEYRSVSDSAFSRAAVRNDWIALKRNDKWAFIANADTFSEGFVYDSVNLLSDNFAWLSSDGTTRIYFANDSSLVVDEDARVRILKPVNVSAAMEYLWVTGGNAEKVYNDQGQLLIEDRYDQIGALGNEYLLVESRGKKGLISAEGEILLKPVYDAIGNYNNGYVSLLRSGRFGIFSATRQVHIPPHYDQRLQPYRDSLLLAKKDDKWAIVNAENEPLTDFIYTTIHYWSDSIALAQGDDAKWVLYNFKSGKNLYEGIDNFTMIKQDDSEAICLFLKRSQYGLMSNVRGEIIGPAFNDIVNYGTDEQPVYFAEKTIREAELVVAVYYNANGEILHRQAFTEEEFENVYCD